MRKTVLAAMVLLATAASAAGAPLFDAADWYRRLEIFAQSLIGRHPADHELIKPPEGIDPQMALVPPPIADRLRIIVPPGEARR